MSVLPLSTPRSHSGPSQSSAHPTRQPLAFLPPQSGLVQLFFGLLPKRHGVEFRHGRISLSIYPQFAEIPDRFHILLAFMSRIVRGGASPNRVWGREDGLKKRRLVPGSRGRHAFVSYFRWMVRLLSSALTSAVRPEVSGAPNFGGTELAGTREGRPSLK